MRTVIFDLDGTLADTGADLLAAANACFREMGHGDVLRLETDKGTALRGGRAMLSLGFDRLGVAYDDDALTAYYPDILRHYEADIHTHTRFYPGVEAAVKGLIEKGYVVGICTNKPVKLAEILIESLGARDWFGALLGADSLPVRKPDPLHFTETVRLCGGDVRRSVLIGDTVTDHDTARAAGVPSVLVGFGPGDTDVRALQPDALLDHFDDLHDVVARLIG
ncbi:HAD hydrolase-like protein [Oceaniglobus ichthyenteri]|uniref:HAD hydrolase-like protein n=1 Tax=Oceaniglobus ichthyenteri TaxID=2136177 RepID=UPI000D3472EA|nr:HAD hydrolase-like protein [Oceaniglobus ichthyenteri]